MAAMVDDGISVIPGNGEAGVIGGDGRAGVMVGNSGTGVMVGDRAGAMVGDDGGGMIVGSREAGLMVGHGCTGVVSRIQLLISKISHICQEICDIKSRKRPQTNIAIRNYINTGLAEERTNLNYTREQGNNSSARGDTGDEDDWGGTYSSHSTLCPHEPSNPDNPSHHAPIPPSPNPLPSESILEPPGDLSPSPASRIATLSPASLL